MLETIKHENSLTGSLPLSLAFIGTKSSAFILDELPSQFFIQQLHSVVELETFLGNQSILTLPDIILIETDPLGKCFTFIEQAKKNPLWRDLIMILVATENNKGYKTKALQLKVQDYYIIPFPVDHLVERLNFLVEFKLIKPQLSVLENAKLVYKLPRAKKLVDIIVSALVIILLSPLFLLTALIVRLSFKGPVIYKNKRVGTGYSIFDLYKFRSMHKQADLDLEQLADINRYVSDEENDKRKAILCRLKNDPATSRLGNFLRFTGIDQLPRFFNVLKGDMSLVGNRPLALFEAEMLSSNEWSQRIMSPVGLTGHWLIKSIGKGYISVQEQKKNDNHYAEKCSFWLDLEILIKTLFSFRATR